MSGDNDREPECDQVDNPEQETPAHTANGEETDDDEDDNISNIHMRACLQLRHSRGSTSYEEPRGEEIVRRPPAICSLGPAYRSPDLVQASKSRSSRSAIYLSDLNALPAADADGSGGLVRR